MSQRSLTMSGSRSPASSRPPAACGRRAAPAAGRPPAMAPAAPGLLSTITGWPSSFCRGSATRRATRSALPPAGPATTRRTGLGRAPGLARQRRRAAGRRPSRGQQQCGGGRSEGGHHDSLRLLACATLPAPATGPGPARREQRFAHHQRHGLEPTVARSFRCVFMPMPAIAAIRHQRETSLPRGHGGGNPARAVDRHQQRRRPRQTRQQRRALAARGAARCGAHQHGEHDHRQQHRHPHQLDQVAVSPVSVRHGCSPRPPPAPRRGWWRPGTCRPRAVEAEACASIG